MSEEEGERTGFLSTRTEIHAFVIGVYEGFKDFLDWDGLDGKAKKNEAVREEIHYAKGGYVMGALLRFFLILTVSIWVI